MWLSNHVESVMTKMLHSTSGLVQNMGIAQPKHWMENMSSYPCDFDGFCLIFCGNVFSNTPTAAHQEHITPRITTQHLEPRTQIMGRNVASEMTWSLPRNGWNLVEPWIIWWHQQSSAMKMRYLLKRWNQSGEMRRTIFLMNASGATHELLGTCTPIIVCNYPIFGNSVL